MKRVANLLKIYFILVCFGCSSEQDEPVLNDFRVTKKLEHYQSPIDSKDIGEVVDILIMDSVLVTSNMYEEFIFKIYNINTGKVINQCISKGRGPGEVLDPNLISKYNDTTFTTFDVNKKELIYYSILELCKGSSSSLKDVQLDFGIFRANPLNDSLVICTGVFEDGEYYLINMNSKDRVSTLEYPYVKQLEMILPFTKGFLLQGELALRPFHNEFVKVCNGAGIIEIGTINDEIMENVFTKVYFNPIFKLNGIHPAFARESKFAFHSLNVTKEYFYTIYSGNSMAEKGGEFTAGHNLLVYNWHGQPVINYQLDRKIKRFTLNIERSIAYGYCTNPTTGEPEIVYYKLPNL